MIELTRTHVEQAAKRINPHINRTPVRHSQKMDELLGAKVYFKCENRQQTGSFKARGATNTVMQLSESVRSIVTHSSGNHGAALAWAGSLRNLQTHVIVPEDTTKVKLANMKQHGANLVYCGTSLKDREFVVEEFIENQKATFIHPYDDTRIVGGQGTAALELLDEVPDLDQIWVPVGGGGLASGTTLAANGKVEVICAEPELAQDAYLSMKKGVRQPPLPPKTIADGLRSSLGELNFHILKRVKTRVKLCSEEVIRVAVKKVYELIGEVIEPSSACTVAAILSEPSVVRNQRVGVIITGGNTSG